MRILAVDSSAVSASCGIYDDRKILSEFFINVGLTHSQTLMCMIEQILKCSSIELDTIDYFAVANGPGSFTGIRIGVSAVKGIAFAQNKKCIGVSTLEAISYNFNQDCVVCAVMDARRQQVYNALFKIQNGYRERLCDDRAISVSDLKQELMSIDGNIIIAGDGTDVCHDIIDDVEKVSKAHENVKFQNSYGVAMAAFDKIDLGLTLNEEDLVPFYLRPSQAERELKLKK